MIFELKRYSTKVATFSVDMTSFKDSSGKLGNACLNIGVSTKPGFRAPQYNPFLANSNF